MITADTGPFGALFHPQDTEHGHCKGVFQSLREPLLTTTPVGNNDSRYLSFVYSSMY